MWQHLRAEWRRTGWQIHVVVAGRWAGAAILGVALGCGQTALAVSSRMAVLVPSETPPLGQTVQQVVLNAPAASVFSLDLRLAYDPPSTPVVAVQKGSLASNMFLAARSSEPGVLLVGLAGGSPLGGEGAVVSVTFDTTAAVALSLSQASVNEGGVSSVITENTAPVLPSQVDRVVVEGNLLTVTNTASDADVPTNTLSYALENPPAGATIDSSGVVTWTPSAAQGLGTYTLTTIVADNGVPQWKSTNSLTVTVVKPPNIAPSFAKGPDITVTQNAGVQAFSNWATAISAGPTNESGQVVDFLVSSDKPYLFAAQPAIAANGTLSFTPATGLRGMTTVTVQAHDNGGTEGGGQDTSGAQTFLITIGASTDADADGLPDDWAAAYGLPPLPPETPARDYDGDGMSDQDELLAGTNPTNAGDALSVAAVGQSNGQESLEVRTVVGKVYRVERNDDFPSGTWEQVGTDVVGTGAVVQVPDAEAAALRRCVYRVRVVE